MFENKERTDISKLGEFGLIDHLTKNITLTNPSTIKGAGDDAAVLDFEGKKVLISTDLLLEGIHFDLAYTPLKHLGYKAIQVNLSDIYAMNGIATQVTVSLGLSSKFPLEAVEELYEGMLIACKKYNVDIAGGDTSSSKQGLVISVTSIGYADEQDICYRNTAEEGDLICVSGDLGGAYVGLQLLEREKNIFLENPQIQPDLEGKDYIVERQLKPEARRDIVLLLKSLGVKPTSMIDVSDGLSSEVIHICTQSEKGCNLYEEKIPLDPMTYETAREFNLDPTVCALSGGEDYELLFTIRQSDYDKIKNDPDISIIGNITEKAAGMNIISKSGIVHPLKAQGWNSFK
ncbi:thiamine-phosphate kinase [Arcticibacter tournemirensis]|uniref:Thiamine-monophosphate kinase n=1 Tax=Arcticibacter tournemirensis TaxID=699437 RepID=A0A4Q0MF35_9SPHI|nr:thiamine-phosphate kinase [Arcticibacter tournemirensis]KAA8479123.1 thiamine-phosphate kinase [Arcticibacter tournemirensis]RXF71895.1 thiamine-phosphate kinase [Arcticibacter tournemirensis]TQM48622.1 thiamine-phosphate kinase [Arcticibacter tournemirensis]